MYTLTINDTHTWRSTNIKDLEGILNSPMWLLHTVKYVITNQFGAPIQQSSIINH